MRRSRALGRFAIPAVGLLIAGCTARRQGPPTQSATDTSATPGATAPSAGSDYGAGADVGALRTIWQNESEPKDTIAQVVVVQNYGVVEVRNGGRNSPFLVLFKRDPSSGWQDQGLITGRWPCAA